LTAIVKHDPQSVAHLIVFFLMTRAGTLPWH
jgi:hypothetical protein